MICGWIPANFVACGLRKPIDRLGGGSHYRGLGAAASIRVYRSMDITSRTSKDMGKKSS